jgi:hypothetical protein
MATTGKTKTLTGATMLPLDSLHVVPGFNARENLALGDMVPLVVARGRVTEPIKVYPDGDGYALISGHRRHGALLLIRAIKAEEVSKEQAWSEHRLSGTDWENAECATVSMLVPAIVQEETTPLQARIESLTSNTGKRLEPLEQAKEFADLKARLKKLTLEELAALMPHKAESILARKKGEKVQNLDIADLTGFGTAHVSQRLALVEKKDDATAEQSAIQERVAKAVADKVISSNDANVILRGATTLKEAVASIDAIAEERAVSAASRKGKKGPEKDDASTPLVPFNAPDVAPPVPSAPLAAPLPSQVQAAQHERDTALVVALLDKHDLTWLADTAEAWAKANGKSVPWTRK